MSGSNMDHPILRLLRVEDLLRQRRPGERQRYAAAQRRGRVDPNPHQIDAVMFALRRIPEGGCILADEVGLGKTIEAGLVISQLLAEGARRILLVLPRPLIGQWRSELYSLFGVDTREVRDPESLLGDGVFVAGREFAGGARGASLIRTAQPFDLCVIDEAHEIFAGIHKRYRADGTYDESSEQARLADRVKQALGLAPVLLLTATPIQNSLAELWGLVQYVEPTGTLLGNLGTFRELFCEPGSSDRALVREQAAELRSRVNRVCQRTLRRQAAEFLERPFTRRQARLFEYEMQPPERRLYEDITLYLMEPRLCAFRGNSRRLLLIAFHRLMASSLAALAKGLDKVADRLASMLDSTQDEAAADLRQLIGDLDDIEEELPAELDSEQAESEDVAPPARDAIAAELERVREFAHRARTLDGDSKAGCLLQAIQLIRERERQGLGSGKVVVFTESLTTQNYLASLLVDANLGLTPQDVTLFRGDNSDERAREALRQWREDVGERLPAGGRPSPDVAVRLALVHEFRHRSRVFISTEAGAKGLNLQFCETIVNYDLPWNPQRIEQRIGRCHRYGQSRDVTVINFISKGNEAQRLTFELLSKKLDLFGQVLDASDVVLHEPTHEAPEALAASIGVEFETELRRIYDRARSPQDLEAELRQLAETLDERRRRFEETQARMQGLIQSSLDDTVRIAFRKIADELPGSLAELDERLDRIVSSYLRTIGAAHSRRVDERQRVLLDIAGGGRLPPELADGARLVLGHSQGIEDYEPLHLGHPLVQAAQAEARDACAPLRSLRLELPGEESLDGARPGRLAPLRGCRGRLLLVRLRHEGFEPFEEVLPLVLLAGRGTPLDRGLATELLAFAASSDDSPPERSVSEEQVADAIDELTFRAQVEVADAEHGRFLETLAQLERYVDDQLLVQQRRRLELLDRQRAAMQTRDTAIGPDARSRADQRLKRIEESLEGVDQRIAALDSRQDEDYQRWREQAHRRRYRAPRVERLADLELVIS